MYFVKSGAWAMNQQSKDALGIWATTLLGGLGGWWGAGRLATSFGIPLGTSGLVAGVILGATAGAVLGKLILQDPGAMASSE